jgi:hypothetical protein
MNAQIDQRLLDGLNALGTQYVRHTSRSFLEHLIGAYELLQEWNNPEHICLAGLFHSIYGTEVFQVETVQLADRQKIIEFIGPKAEHLAYLFCAMDRAFVFDAANRLPPHLFKDRFTQQRYEIAADDYAALVELGVANLVEQKPRLSAMKEERQEFLKGLYSVALTHGSAGAAAAYRQIFQVQ